MATIHAKAIGGGIDAPRSCNVMIAEEQASFVYPEIKFNHFPITAVAILSRRMGAARSRGDAAVGRGDERGGLHGRRRARSRRARPAPARPGCANTRPTRCRSMPPRPPCSPPSTAAPATCARSSTYLGQIWTDCMLRLSPSAISKLQRIAATQDRMLARVYQRMRDPAPALLRRLSSVAKIALVKPVFQTKSLPLRGLNPLRRSLQHVTMRCR